MPFLYELRRHANKARRRRLAAAASSRDSIRDAAVAASFQLYAMLLQNAYSQHGLITFKRLRGRCESGSLDTFSPSTLGQSRHVKDDDASTVPVATS